MQARARPTHHTAGAAIKRNTELFFPAEFADDFPVSLQISAKYGLVYVITKLGLLFVYDLETATAVYRNRISPDPIFLAVGSESTGGFYAINRCVALLGNVSSWALPQRCYGGGCCNITTKARECPLCGYIAGYMCSLNASLWLLLADTPDVVHVPHVICP
jgi:hypothetical protein